MRRRVRLSAALLVIVVAALTSAASGLPPLAPRLLSSDPETRALWIVRDTLATKATIHQAVDEAAAHGFNTLLVQVRGRGDAYYTGGVEPRSHLLATGDPSFDPLATVLERAHAAGMKVHAWVNVNLVASANLLPASRDHVANQHPEWLMVPRALASELSRAAPKGPGYVGRLARWTRAQPESVEGLFLSPIVPAAASHTVAVIEDLARRYPVDGVHLDYVRYPNAQFDHSRLALAEFASAMSVTLPPPERTALEARAKDDVLAWVDEFPDRWADFRRSRLTALMMRLRTSLRAVREDLLVSAAVFPGARDAFNGRLQDWRSWTESGLLDVLCPMAYTSSVDAFASQIEEAVRVAAPAAVWAGIGAYRLTAEQTVAQIESARLAGARGVVLFSYEAVAPGRSHSYLPTVRRTAFAARPSGTSNGRR